MPNLKFNPTGTKYLQDLLAIRIRQSYRNKLKDIMKKIDDNKTTIESFIATESALSPGALMVILSGLNNVSEELKPLVYSVLGNAWNKSMKDLKVDVNKPIAGINLGVKSHIQNNAFSFVTKLANEERERLREVLETTISQGDSISVIKKEVKQAFSNVAWRSEVIARTEVIRAYNVGSLHSMKAAGIEKYEWISSLDERVRKQHRIWNGQIFSVDRALKKLDPIPTEVYINGKWNASLSVNCRCSIRAVID